MKSADPTPTDVEALIARLEQAPSDWKRGSSFNPTNISIAGHALSMPECAALVRTLRAQAETIARLRAALEQADGILASLTFHVEDGQTSSLLLSATDECRVEIAALRDTEPSGHAEGRTRTTRQ